MEEIKMYEKVSPLEKNFPVKFQFSNGKNKTGLHWHEHMEFLYYKSDNNIVQCNGKSYKVGKGQLVVIAPNEPHCTLGGTFYCLRIAPSFFNDVFFDNMYFNSIIPYDKVIEECFENIQREITKLSEGYDFAIKSITYRFMTHLIRNYRISKENVKSENGFSRDVITYIAKNCHNKINTASVAGYFHLSENYFCSLFKKNIGISPIEYINKYRIEKAAVLLESTDESITNICYHLGFNDSNYFSRVFKKYMGISPREYRNSKRKPDLNNNGKG